jgi:hypothetical protein
MSKGALPRCTTAPEGDAPPEAGCFSAVCCGASDVDRAHHSARVTLRGLCDPNGSSSVAIPAQQYHADVSKRSDRLLLFAPAYVAWNWNDCLSRSLYFHRQRRSLGDVNPNRMMTTPRSRASRADVRTPAILSRGPPRDLSASGVECPERALQKPLAPNARGRNVAAGREHRPCAVQPRS